MNILIVTPFYKHDRNIASVRWTNLSRRLSKRHNVIVVTQPFDDMDMTVSKGMDDGMLVGRINQKTLYEKIAVRHFGGATGDDWQTKSEGDTQAAKTKMSMVRRIKDRVLYASMQAKAKDYARVIKRDIVPDGRKIDVVISSACPFIEMLIGYELKKVLKCKWISDFRDLPFVEDSTEGTHRMKRMMQHCLKKAEAVITIAPKGKDFLVDNGIVDADKTHVITNGFSMADARQSCVREDGVLHLVHTGSLYGGRRKADLLFKAMRRIKDEAPELKVQFECAGGNNRPICETAERYGVADLVIDRGFMSRDEAIALQNSADCLVAIVENFPGSLSAKLFEYTLCRKPVICVTCGGNDESDATKYVQDLNIGLAVEERIEADAERLYMYLKESAESKLQGKPIPYAPREERVKEYDHDRIAEKIEVLCDKVIKG